MILAFVTDKKEWEEKGIFSNNKQVGWFDNCPELERFSADKGWKALSDDILKCKEIVESIKDDAVNSWLLAVFNLTDPSQTILLTSDNEIIECICEQMQEL